MPNSTRALNLVLYTTNSKNAPKNVMVRYNRHSDFNSLCVLSVYSSFKCLNRNGNYNAYITGFDPQQPTTRAQYVAPHSGLVDVNKPLPKRNFMPTYHKQSWKQTPGGFKPKSNTQFI